MIHQQVAEAIKDFFSLQEKCVNHIISEQHSLIFHIPDWPEFTQSRLNPAQRAIQAIKDLEIKPGEDARSTRFYPGVIEADQETLDLFCSLNESKDRFKEAMGKLKSESPRDHRLFNSYVKTRRIDPREKRYGRAFGPISLNHIYRKFVVFNNRPVSLSYSWTCRSASIVVVSKKEAIRALEDLNSELPVHLMIQREKLLSLPDTERLVKMIPSTAGGKVNVVFRNGEMETIKPALPMLIPKGDAPVRIKFLDEEKIRKLSSRRVRSDKKIEDSPIAPSINLYRYRETFRSSK